MSDTDNRKNWLITGGSSGIGRSLAEAALAHGHRVVGTVRDREHATQFEQLWPGRAVAVVLDVAQPPSVAAGIHAAGQALGGRVDVLVNNAGWGLVGAIEETSMDEAHEVFETNFFAPFGIKVTVLTLGIFRTHFASSSLKQTACVMSEYAQTPAGFPGVDRSDQLVVVASGLQQDAATDVLPLRADARLLAGRIQAGRSLSYEIGVGHDLYLVPSTGTVRVGGIEVEAGDGVAVINQATVEFEVVQDVELVAVELA